MIKRFLIILVMLFWCNVSFAAIEDLDIDIKKSELETETLKPNKEYRQSCKTDVYIEEVHVDLKFNSYIDSNGMN